MGSFDYNDNYSSFDNLLERCEVFTEGGKGLGGYYSGFGRGLTSKLRDVGSTAVPRDSRKFVVHVLYTQLEPKIITDEDLTELESAGPEAGSRYNLTLQKILDIHKDEITNRADEIGQIIEDRFPALANEILGRGPQRIQGNIDARKAKLAAKEIANDIKQGEDIDDSIDDALDSVMVQAAISKVLTNIQTSLGEPGLDIEEEALQEVVDYVDRIQTVDQLSDFVRQIAKEPGYQKIALYLSAVVKPLRKGKGEEGEEEGPYEADEPGGPAGAYAENETGQNITQIEDEEVISRESLNNNMRKRKLLFEKKKNWNRFRSNRKQKLVVEKDTEKERRYEDRWDKDLDREREREGSSSAGEYSDVDKDDFCGPAGGAAPGTYPVNSEKRARAALSYAHNAPDPEGIKRCVYRKAKEHGWFNEEDEELSGLDDLKLAMDGDSFFYRDVEKLVRNHLRLPGWKLVDREQKKKIVMKFLNGFEVSGKDGKWEYDDTGGGRGKSLFPWLPGQGNKTDPFYYHKVVKVGEDEEFSMSPMLDSHKTDTSGYLTEQVAKDKRNKIKPKTENRSFKERFKPKSHWQLQELRRRGL